MNNIKTNDNISFSTYDDNLKYLEELSRFDFNLCPPGNGLDTHRVWESILVNTHPIVQINNVNVNFFNMGVPLILNKNFENISKTVISEIKEEINLKKYENSIKFIQFNYWWDLISSKKI